MDQDHDQFMAAMGGFGSGALNAAAVVDCLGPNRRGEVAKLAREELKIIFERREPVDDLIGLYAGTPWTMEEEKSFEHALFMYDGSVHDRFGMISNVMCGTRSREDCKKRYMRLVMDICQIENGQKNITVTYAVAAPVVPALPSPSTGRQVWMM